jgi:hypothetical protein
MIPGFRSAHADGGLEVAFLDFIPQRGFQAAFPDQYTQTWVTTEAETATEGTGERTSGDLTVMFPVH